jgi:hypothetical protein
MAIRDSTETPEPTLLHSLCETTLILVRLYKTLDLTGILESPSKHGLGVKQRPCNKIILNHTALENTQSPFVSIFSLSEKIQKA